MIGQIWMARSFRWRLKKICFFFSRNPDSRTGFQDIFGCGGTLINRRYVLTVRPVSGCGVSVYLNKTG
jgi:hypothetical protein